MHYINFAYGKLIITSDVYLPNHSSRGGLPFSAFHHSEGAVSQFLVEGEVSVTDEAGEISWLTLWLS